MRFLSPLLLLAVLPLTAANNTPVILISIDTLRADHVGRHTPHIDSLKQNGTVFSQATTPYPLTLPAHTALLTSTFPFSNGVLDNGIPLNPSTATLATSFKKLGYRTAAFVGSFVLDRRFGLNRDFDVYDGPLDVHNNPLGEQVERKRPGNQVADSAKRWLEANGNAPFFVFLHLYDLHTPYSLPANPSQRHGETGYQAELSYVDQVLGEFFAFLQQRGLLQKALIVFTSDHGEGLGDHGESSHGYFVYQSTLHVPLIFHWPANGAKRVAQDHMDEPVSLLDVAPTILESVGIKKPAEMRGRNLLETKTGQDVYSESVYARRHFGCASLRAMRSGNLKYIDAPKPELYDLAADPGEQHNLYDQQKAKAGSLRERIAAVRAASPVAPARAANPSPETAAILRSLGYLSGSNSSSRVEPRVDPKERIADFEHYVQALAMATAGQPAASNGILAPMAEKLSDVLDVRVSLGMNRLRLNQNAEAVSDFKKAIQLETTNASAHFELGFAYFRLRQGDDAIKEFQATLALEPWYSRADEALAELFLAKKDMEQARAHLDHLLATDPASYTAHFNLGVMAAMAGDWNGAEQHLNAALQADPNSAEAHKTLGMIYQQEGKTAEAEKQFRAAH